MSKKTPPPKKYGQQVLIIEEGIIHYRKGHNMYDLVPSCKTKTNIVESGAKHHQTNKQIYSIFLVYNSFGILFQDTLEWEKKGVNWLFAQYGMIFTNLT
jgi:hypothetical protein